MGIFAELVGKVRGLTVDNNPENDLQLVAMNSRRDLIVSQGLPELTEIVRMGETWQLASVTGQAALTALPTTVSGLSLYNNEPPYGKCYIIDSFGSWEAVVDATQTDNTAIFAMMNLTPATKPTDSALAIRSTIGKKYGGKAISAVGLTVTNEGWFPHGTLAAQMAAAAAGANWKVNEVLAKGFYIIPPQGMFNIQAVKAAAAAALDSFFFIRFHAVQLIINQ